MTHRPRVICHMSSSVDGRIDVLGWPSIMATVRKAYDRIHYGFEPDAWMCGRISMAGFAGGVRSDAEIATDGERAGVREDFRAPGDFKTFAFAIDPSGRLRWKTNAIDGDHIVEVLTERVSDAYLAELRDRGVSYLFGGAREIDFSAVLTKIAEQYKVRTLMLEGGGNLNGSMLQAGVIDELSVLLAPVVDGRTGKVGLIDADPAAAPVSVSLESVERLDDGVLWLRYQIAKKAAQSETA